MRLRFYSVGAVLAAALGAGSCTAPNDQTFVITSGAALAATSGGFSCDPNNTMVFVSGVLDLDLADGYGVGYAFCPLVTNNLVSNTSTGIQSSQLVAQRVEVDVLFDPNLGITFPDDQIRFYRDLFKVLGPGDRFAAPVEVIPVATARTLRANAGQLFRDGGRYASAVVKVRYVASHNGDIIRSNDISYRIDFIMGSFNNMRGLVNDVGACCADAVNKGSPNIVQDSVIDCCDAPGGRLQCPAVKRTDAMCAPAAP